jgi:hypothetical protein
MNTQLNAIKQALAYLEGIHPGNMTPMAEEYWNKAIATIKQALNDATQLAAQWQEPVVWEWHQAPVKTQWGDDMAVADLAIDKDHTVSVYCERDQTTKVEAMFTSPHAAPVQEPVGTQLVPVELTQAMKQAWVTALTPGDAWKAMLAAAPAAQRQWVGLEDDELSEVYNQADWDTVNGWEYERAIEAKLKAKNSP